jgi:hypothetical protein
MYFDVIIMAEQPYEYLTESRFMRNDPSPPGQLILTSESSCSGWCLSDGVYGHALGALMLPILYVALKNMFGKTVVAHGGTTLFGMRFHALCPDTHRHH